MKLTKTILAGFALAATMATASVAAEGHADIEKQSWSFAGIFGTYDQNQLQRGYQVYREVCAACHGTRLVAFRNLMEPGGPSFSEAQVRALAAEYQIADPTAAGGTRPGVPADLMPRPYPTEQDARDANGGAYPPDLSVMAKARGVADPFPFWVFNYFTGYQEGGVDYIYNLLLGYEEEVPADSDVQLGPGQFYNHVYPGNAISMAPPLFDGLVAYGETDSESGATVPATAEQYSRDVSAYLMWAAEPHLVSRKETGFRVLLFLVLFAGLLWATKNRIWKNVEH